MCEPTSIALGLTALSVGAGTATKVISNKKQAKVRKRQAAREAQIAADQKADADQQFTTESSENRESRKRSFRARRRATTSDITAPFAVSPVQSRSFFATT